MQHPNLRGWEHSRPLQDDLLGMDCLYELSVDLQESAVIGIIRVASEFDEEGPWTLCDSFRESEVQFAKSFF